MDTISIKAAYSSLLLFFFIAIGGFIQKGHAQSSYELLPAPDIWYNSVDGVRVGGRLRGQQAGTFGDGPHRLNLGFWVGTKFPETPVSYFLSFTEPISSISDFGSEGNLRIISSYRTGFQQHGISFNKRWQNGFNETNYKELSIGMRGEHRFNSDYLLYPQLWQDSWLYIGSLNFLMTSDNKPGRYRIMFSADANVAGSHDRFIRSIVSLQQRFDIEPFTLHSGFFTGVASDNAAPEYRFIPSLKSARGWMESGLTRARGTIPPAWMNSGTIQIAGGPNLRGYIGQDSDLLETGSAPLFTSFASLNLELDYPNPLDKAITDIPIVGSFVKLRSYAFFDSGTSLGLREIEKEELISDAGLGFELSLNIPDFLGKRRGVMFRYDIPLWLSHPGNENAFKYRSVVGIGAVISL